MKVNQELLIKISRLKYDMFHAMREIGNLAKEGKNYKDYLAKLMDSPRLAVRSGGNLRAILKKYNLKFEGIGAFRLAFSRDGLVAKVPHNYNAGDWEYFEQQERRFVCANQTELKVYRNILRTPAKYFAMPILAAFKLNRKDVCLIFPKVEILGDKDDEDTDFDCTRRSILDGIFTDMHSSNYGVFMDTYFATDFGGHEHPTGPKRVRINRVLRSEGIDEHRKQQLSIAKRMSSIFKLQKSTLNA